MYYILLILNSTFVPKYYWLKNILSIRLSIVVEKYLKKNNKKDLTNSNRCGLSISLKRQKKLALNFNWYLNMVFITIFDKNPGEFINFAGCLHPVNNILYRLYLSH